MEVAHLTRGPDTEAMPNMPPINAVKLERFSSGTENAMMMSAPESTPAPPRPAIARPAMNMAEVLAAPQMTEPTSKMSSAIRKVHFRE